MPCLVKTSQARWGGARPAFKRGRPRCQSPSLTAVLKHWNTPRPRTKADRDMIARLSDYPHNSREAVFCWLWDNHKGGTEMIGKWMCSWNGVAVVMREDGIKGSRGADPTGNAVRRV